MLLLQRFHCSTKLAIKFGRPSRCFKKTREYPERNDRACVSK
jgi:hypothetical protein